MYCQFILTQCRPLSAWKVAGNCHVIMHLYPWFLFQTRGIFPCCCYAHLRACSILENFENLQRAWFWKRKWKNPFSAFCKLTIFVYIYLYLSEIHLSHSKALGRPSHLQWGYSFTKIIENLWNVTRDGKTTQ